MCKCSRKQSTLKDRFIYIILRRRGRKCCGQIKTKIKFFAINSTHCVWKKTNTAYDKKNSIPTVKHGIVYTGGCFSAKVIRRLLRIKGLVEDNLLPLNSKFTAHYKVRSVMLGALAPAHMSWSKWVFFRWSCSVYPFWVEPRVQTCLVHLFVIVGNQQEVYSRSASPPVICQSISILMVVFRWRRNSLFHFLDWINVPPSHKPMSIWVDCLPLPLAADLICGIFTCVALCSSRFPPSHLPVLLPTSFSYIWKNRLEVALFLTLTWIPSPHIHSPADTRKPPTIPVLLIFLIFSPTNH